jgi:hypothetical protein
VSPPPSVSGAHCGAHPAAAAVELCSRCGTFLCGECVEYFQEVTPACAACLPLLGGGAASMRARLAPALALAGLGGYLVGFLVPGRAGIAWWVSSLPLGFSALALSVQELRLIRDGQAGSRGRHWARVGLGLGVAYALLLALLVLTFVLFTYRQLDRGG